MEVTHQGCAEMAARMLDEELYAVMRKVEDEDDMTPLQEAVAAELRNRLMLVPPPWKN